MKENQRKCCKCGCSPAEDPNITLHRFPKPGRTNSLRCELWAKYCFPHESWWAPEVQNKLHSRHLMLCTKHFKRSSFIDNSGKKLVKSAAPDEESDKSNSLEQSAMSDSPSSLEKEKKERNSQDCGLRKDISEAGPKSMLFCICCLQRGTPYINLRTCCHADFLNNFVMPELRAEDQVICYQCHNMLKKIKLFKLQVEESFKLLSDSVETIANSSQQNCNLQKHQIFTIDIPSTWKKRKIHIKKVVYPQVKRKKAKTDIDNLLKEEIPKTINTEIPQTIPEQTRIGVDNRFIDKKTKNIEDALKIIKINQNSGCIDLLASSLKTISYSLLSNINNINYDITNQIGRNPTGILFSNTTPTNDATTISGDNITINNITEISNTNLVVGNETNGPADILFSNITPTNDATSISSDNIIINNTTENSKTNLEMENQISRNPTDKLFSINAPTTTKTTSDSSHNNTSNNTTENNDITIEDRLKNNIPEIVGNVANEELDSLEKDESMDGGQSNMQMDEAFMNRPSIHSKIRQVTLTREQLTEERSKMASSHTFLCLPHRCDTCLVGFQFRENLGDHILRKHTEDKIRNPEKCDVCLQFMEACNYDKHLFWHLTRYECVACSQQFASYDKAAQHYRKLHRSAKPRALFKCPQCPYKTQFMCRLKRHIRRVTKCKKCGDRIAHGCGTGMTLDRHTVRCKGTRPELNRAVTGPKTGPYVKHMQRIKLRNKVVRSANSD